MSANYWVEEVECETAESFVGELRPSSGRWGSCFSGRERSRVEPAWIFRGQREAEWKLIPSIWRLGLTSGLKELVDEFYLLAGSVMNAPGAPRFADVDETHLRSVLAAFFFELEMVYRFGRAADKQGFYLGELSEVVSAENLAHRMRPDELMQQAAFGDLRAFLPVQLAALTQHHGIPTRLLDWSDNGLVAAFFAIQQADVSDGAQLAVWALDTEFFDRSSGSSMQRFEVVRVPTFNFLNLHAQRGLFTWWAGEAYYLENGYFPSLLDTLDIKEFAVGYSGKPIRKLKLVHSEIPSLTRLLWKEGINVMSMKPNLDSVGRGVREELRLEFGV